MVGKNTRTGIVLNEICEGGSWTRRCKNFVRLTPMRVYSYTHACHSELHPVLQVGSDSLSKCRQAPATRCIWEIWKQFLCSLKSLACKLSYQSACLWHLPWYVSGSAFLQPADEKVKAIKKAPTARNMLAALTNFIPMLSTLAHPLYELIGNTPRNWSPSCEKALWAVKSALTSETVLVHYDPKLPMELSIEASPYGLGAVECTFIPMETVARFPTRYELWINTNNATSR